jgi:hypothetical protein
LPVRGPIAGAVVALMLLPAPPAVAFQALKARVTITGRSTGSSDIRSAETPEENPDCPAQITEQRVETTVSWHVTYANAIVPLARSRYLQKVEPGGGHGGPTGGSASFSGAYLRDDPANPEACPTLTPYSASAELRRKARPGPELDDLSYAPAVLFGAGYVTGELSDVIGSPTTLQVPQGESTGQPGDVPSLSVAQNLALWPVKVRRGARLQALESGVLIDWDKLQSRVHALRHRRTITLSVSGGLSNAHAGAQFQSDCYEGLLSCTETMHLHYRITVRRTGYATCVNAQHCD